MAERPLPEPPKAQFVRRGAPVAPLAGGLILLWLAMAGLPIALVILQVAHG